VDREKKKRAAYKPIGKKRAKKNKMFIVSDQKKGSTGWPKREGNQKGKKRQVLVEEKRGKNWNPTCKKEKRLSQWQSTLSP